MARRGGKAANRQSRQKRAQRNAQRAAQRPAAAAPAAPELTPEFTPDAGDAFEKADAEVRAATAPPGATAGVRGRPGPRRPTRPEPGFNVSGSSRLSERAVAEYHYVTRDLRNIAVLFVIMVVLLAVATVVVNLLAIGQV